MSRKRRNPKHMHQEKKGSHRFQWHTGLTFKNANRRFNDIPQPISWQTDIRNSPLLDNIFINTKDSEVNGQSKIELIQRAVSKQTDSFQRISWSTINLPESSGTSEPNMKTKPIIPDKSPKIAAIGGVKKRKSVRRCSKTRVPLKAGLLEGKSPNIATIGRVKKITSIRRSKKNGVPLKAGLLEGKSAEIATIGRVKKRSSFRRSKKKKAPLKTGLLEGKSPMQSLSSSCTFQKERNVTVENNKLSFQIKAPADTSSLDDSVILVGAVYKASSSNIENNGKSISPGKIIEDTKFSVKGFAFVEDVFPKDSDGLVDLTRFPMNDRTPINRNKQTKCFDKLSTDDSEVLVDLTHKPGVSNNKDLILLEKGIEKVTENPAQASKNSSVMDDSVILIDASHSDESLNNHKINDSGIMVISDTEDEINMVKVVSSLPNPPVTSSTSNNLHSNNSKDLEIVCVKKIAPSSEIIVIPDAPCFVEKKKRKPRLKNPAQNTANQVLKNTSNQQQCKNTDVIPVEFSFTKQIRHVTQVNQMKVLPGLLGPIANPAIPIPNCSIFSGLGIGLGGFRFPLKTSTTPTPPKVKGKRGLCSSKFRGKKGLRPSNFQGERRLRPIVIDASNVAMCHGQSKKFSCAGIELCVKYFQDRGHKEITAFVPQYRRNKSKDVEGQNILERYHLSQTVVFTPSRFVDGKLINSYDDRFILDFAAKTGGVIVSNDNYRDIKNEKPEWLTAVNDRLLMFLFVGDIFMVPEDPLGRAGIKLDDFLSFPSLALQNTT